tara:strand:- start:297 stop:629 length:333 start_codon:yes stop_codon:yes gene_type:complete
VFCPRTLEPSAIPKKNKDLEDNLISLGSARSDLFWANPHQYDSRSLAYVYPSYGDWSRLRYSVCAAAFYITSTSKVYPDELVNARSRAGIELERLARMTTLDVQKNNLKK